MSKPGLTPLGEALIRIENVLDEATEPDTLLSILKEIRKVEVGQTEFVPEGTAGALIYRVKKDV